MMSFAWLVGGVCCCVVIFFLLVLFFAFMSNRNTGGEWVKNPKEEYWGVPTNFKKEN